MGNLRRQSNAPRPLAPDNYPTILPLPAQSQDAFRRRQAPNIGLLFERYIQFQNDWQLKDIGKNKPSSKQYLLNELVKAAGETDDSGRLAFAQRWQEMVKPAQPWQMTPTWRFVTGMGNKTALEVGFTFHRVYGFPYLPSSGLKGLARAVALLEIAQQSGEEMAGLQEVLPLLKDKKPTRMQQLETALLEEEKKFPTALQAWVKKAEMYENAKPLAEQFRTVFGTTHHVGHAIFHDAIPAAKPTLEVDVMTVHYPDYYQDEKNSVPPADTQNPRPIPFLTVGKTPFWFAVGWRQGHKENAAHEKAVAWLQFGLTELGAGAKTAAGYGYFQE